MFVRLWNHLSCHDVLEKMTSECNLEIPTDRKFSGSAVNVLHALPNIFGCRRRRVKTWLTTNINLEILLEDRNILFAYGDKTELVNYIYGLAKYYIYKNKFASRNLSIQGFVSLLKKKMLSERYTLFINNKTLYSLIID